MPDYPVEWTSTRTHIMVARSEDKAASRAWLLKHQDRQTIILHPGDQLIIENQNTMQLRIQHTKDDQHAKLD